MTCAAGRNHLLFPGTISASGLSCHRSIRCQGGSGGASSVPRQAEKPRAAASPRKAKRRRRVTAEDLSRETCRAGLSSESPVVDVGEGQPGTDRGELDHVLRPVGLGEDPALVLVDVMLYVHPVLCDQEILGQSGQ